MHVIPYDVDDELGLAAGGLVLSFVVVSSESMLLLLWTGITTNKHQRKHKGQRKKFTDTKSRQVKMNRNFPAGIPAEPASEPVCSGWEPVSRPVSRFASAENPAGRFLSRFSQFVKLANFLGKTAPKTSDSRGFRQNQAMGITRNIDRSPTH